jgi:hypothetical protein
LIARFEARRRTGLNIDFDDVLEEEKKEVKPQQFSHQNRVGIIRAQPVFMKSNTQVS